MDTQAMPLSTDGAESPVVDSAPTVREMLMARGRLGHARMYLWDLENGSDFSRMVDSRGSPFNCSKARWIEIILKIAGETLLLLPDDTRLVLDRLKVACPEVVIPVELLPIDTPVQWNDSELAAVQAKRVKENQT